MIQCLRTSQEVAIISILPLARAMLKGQQVLSRHFYWYSSEFLFIIPIFTRWLTDPLESRIKKSSSRSLLVELFIEHLSFFACFQIRIMSIVVLGRMGFIRSWMGIEYSTVGFRCCLISILFIPTSMLKFLIPYPHTSGGNLSAFRGSNAFSFKS